jgi:hypothetical protein
LMPIEMDLRHTNSSPKNVWLIKLFVFMRHWRSKTEKPLSIQKKLRKWHKLRTILSKLRPLAMSSVSLLCYQKEMTLPLKDTNVPTWTSPLVSSLSRWITNQECQGKTNAWSRKRLYNEQRPDNWNIIYIFKHFLVSLQPFKTRWKRFWDFAKMWACRLCDRNVRSRIYQICRKVMKRNEWYIPDKMQQKQSFGKLESFFFVIIIKMRNNW